AAGGGERRRTVRLEEEIAELVAAHPVAGRRCLQIATAESATAGRIADTLTNVAGSSAYVLGGVVAYSNEAKRQLLGVETATLSEHGAVSKEVACEMAEGGRIALGADLCVADTGIAGPGGGSETKPVGLFFVALASREMCEARTFRFDGDRGANKDAAVRAALTMLRDHLLQFSDRSGANEHDFV
ncbi:MAG: CinA family protein, partial [Chloroflexi bacterium]|nr:CinA family protein [Chloroflexota bacterium]